MSEKWNREMCSLFDVIIVTSCLKFLIFNYVSGCKTMTQHMFLITSCRLVSDVCSCRLVSDLCSCRLVSDVCSCRLVSDVCSCRLVSDLCSCRLVSDLCICRLSSLSSTASYFFCFLCMCFSYFPSVFIIVCTVLKKHIVTLFAGPLEPYEITGSYIK